MLYLDARMFEMSGIGTYIKMITQDNDIYDIYLGDVNILEKYYESSKCINYNSKIYGIDEQLKFPYKKIKKNSVLHCPHYNVPIFYRGKLITTIHDITHILFPEYLPNKLAYLYAMFMIKIACLKSNIIITGSENTKKDLIKHFKIKSEKIRITYYARSHIYKKIDKKEIIYLYERYKINYGKKIILYVGNKKPHKNLERLLHAFYKSKFKNEAVLIFVGKDFGAYTKLQELTSELELDDKIIHTGIISDEELVGTYNMADLFVFPTLYEGFGIPPLEAMACGTPVIASTTPAVKEVLGDAAYYFDPYNIDEISEAINTMMTDEELRLKFINKGLKQIEKYSVEKLRRDTINIYKTML